MMNVYRTQGAQQRAEFDELFVARETRIVDQRMTERTHLQHIFIKHCQQRQQQQQQQQQQQHTCE
jgi:hypothetical protein